MQDNAVWVVWGVMVTGFLICVLTIGLLRWLGLPRGRIAQKVQATPTSITPTPSPNSTRWAQSATQRAPNPEPLGGYKTLTPSPSPGRGDITAATPAPRSQVSVSPVLPQKSTPSVAPISPPQENTPKRVPKKQVDFDRHDHKPGWLYLARNDEYRPGLYKMGLSGDIEHRRQTLNEASVTAKDIGEVRILHRVAVPAMGLAEKALFAACNARRVSQGAEYFMGTEAVFRLALDATAAAVHGHAQAINDFHADNPLARLDPMPDRYFGMDSGPRLNATPAVYLLRNPWHAEGIYRYACTSIDGQAFMQVMENRQRKENGVFGFYRVIAVYPVDDAEAAKSVLRAAARPFTFASRFSFLQGDRANIEVMLEKALQRIAPIRASQAAGLEVLPLTKPKVSERPWNPPCPHCGQLLRFRGVQIGMSAVRPCPSCLELMAIHIGPAQAVASPLHKASQATTKTPSRSISALGPPRARSSR